MVGAWALRCFSCYRYSQSEQTRWSQYTLLNVIFTSQRPNCLLPGLHAWLLAPLLSCGRPLIWVHPPQLWEPPVGTVTKLKGMRKWQQQVSTGKLARTVSLRLLFVQSQASHLPKLSSQVPCNLLQAHTGNMTGLPPERCWLVLQMVDICFCLQCFLLIPPALT